MEFALTPRMLEMQSHLQVFIDRHILPANVEWHREVEVGRYPMPLLDRLKDRAKAEGLWNLFLPGLREDEPGTRLSNLEYAPLAEIMGRIPWAAEVFNCNAPDTGNIELLHLFATQEQSDLWLKPLLEGDIRSCFAMTEPDVASSDATNIRTTIRRQGDQYVINGRKWFITGAVHPNCRVAIVLGISDESPGVEVVRNVPIVHHVSPEGHCELLFKDVRVPAANLLGEEGNGFSLAQARLGPGRVHHCMCTIGQ